MQSQSLGLSVTDFEYLNLKLPIPTHCYTLAMIQKTQQKMQCDLAHVDIGRSTDVPKLKYDSYVMRG